MTAWHVVLLLVAGLAAGGVNAVAGGGTLLTFPALLAAGLHPVSANVTNSVALWPGYLSTAASYRDRLQDRDPLVRLAVASIGGAVLGTVILLVTPASVFHVLVPYLVFAATGLLAAQPSISRWLAKRGTSTGTSPLLPPAIFVAATYGAYFGGGLGIVLLAVLALALPLELNVLNELKAWLQLTVNTVALVGFAAFGPVDWRAAAIVAPASFLGGIGGARVARRLDPRVLRAAVVVFGSGVGIRLLFS